MYSRFTTNYMLNNDDGFNINKNAILLDELEEYMSNNLVVFELPQKFDKVIFTIIGMPIKRFKYPLNIIGLTKMGLHIQTKYNKLKHPITSNGNNFYINEISKPKNNIEELVYSYVKKLIEPYLPIKIEEKMDFDEGGDWWKLEPEQKISNLHIILDNNTVTAYISGYCYTNNI